MMLIHCGMPQLQCSSMCAFSGKMLRITQLLKWWDEHPRPQRLPILPDISKMQIFTGRFLVSQKVGKWTSAVVLVAEHVWKDRPLASWTSEFQNCVEFQALKLHNRLYTVYCGDCITRRFELLSQFFTVGSFNWQETSSTLILYLLKWFHFKEIKHVPPSRLVAFPWLLCRRRAKHFRNIFIIEAAGSSWVVLLVDGGSWINQLRV